MIIDQFTLILGITVILLAIIASLASPFLHKVKMKSGKQIGGHKETQPNLSIVIPVHNNATELQSNLPILLRQEYKGSYQVIIVADKGDRDVEELMKRLKEKHDNLYVTYLPDSSRYMSRKKLAITLGVRAAKTEWIAITNPTCKPVNEDWLTSWAENMEDDTDFVMGYVALGKSVPPLWRFEHIQTANNRLHSAQCGKAWATNCFNIAFRKSRFMEEEGFRGNLQITRGEYDFLTNKLGLNRNVTVDIRQASWLYEDEISDEEWKKRKKYFYASRNLLNGSRSYSLCMLFNNVMLYLSFLTSLACSVFGYLSHNWIVLGCSSFSLLLLIVLRTFLASKVSRCLGGDIGLSHMFAYDMRLVWQNLGYKISYIRSDKNYFTSHKL